MVDSINYLLRKYNLKIVQEIGCDIDNILFYDIKTAYSGYDVKQVVDICNEKTRRMRGGLQYFFSDVISYVDSDAHVCILNKMHEEILNQGRWNYIITTEEIDGRYELIETLNNFKLYKNVK